MFPGLKEAFARLSREDFGGTAIQTTTTVDSVKSAEQMKTGAGSVAQSDERANPASIGGAIGGFMRRRQQQKEQEAPANANPARSTFMTINNEVLKIASNVTASDVALPAGLKETELTSVSRTLGAIDRFSTQPACASASAILSAFGKQYCSSTCENGGCVSGYVTRITGASSTSNRLFHDHR